MDTHHPLQPVIEACNAAWNRHPVARNGMTHEPAGRVIRWNGMDIIPMRDGRVARNDVYAESLSYLRQPGAPL